MCTTQAGKLDEHEEADALPASSSASESQGDSADADLETGIAEWRARGLPPAQSKAQRWGAPYHLQFAILFTRSACSLSNHAIAPCHCCCQKRCVPPLDCIKSVQICLAAHQHCGSEAPQLGESSVPTCTFYPGLRCSKRHCLPSEC